MMRAEVDAAKRRMSGIRPAKRRDDPQRTSTSLNEPQRPSTSLNEPQRASTSLVVHRNMFSCAMFDSEAPNMPMNSEQLCPAAA
jgi:hypothetical protein